MQFREPRVKIHNICSISAFMRIACFLVALILCGQAFAGGEEQLVDNSVVEAGIRAGLQGSGVDASGSDRGDLIERLSKEVAELKNKNRVTSKVEEAKEKPQTAKFVGSSAVYSFVEGKIFEVHSGVDKVTDIVLEAGEKITSEPVAGDTVRWKVSSLVSGEGEDLKTHIVIKPLEAEIETNLILSTNRRTYHLHLYSSDWYMPQVSWNYAGSEKVKVVKEEKVEKLEIAPDNLNFGYLVKGSEWFSPVRVFDDGKKTYLQMPSGVEVSEAPALFIINDGEAELCNYRVVSGYYIIDRLVERLELRVGKRSVLIVKEGLESFWEKVWSN